MFNKILVPLDGSELSERSIAPATAIAARTNGELILMRVPKLAQMLLSPGFAGGKPDVLERDNPQLHLYDISQDYLFDVALANPHPNVTMYTIVGEGKIPTTILDTANQQDIDLIVMATHGRSGPTRWIWGSMTEKVLKMTNLPLLTLRTDHPIQNVMVPFDGSALAESVLQSAVEIVQAVGGSLILSHTAAKSGSRNGTSFAADPKSYLKQLAERYSMSVPRLQIHINIGKPAQGILEAAKERNADLIVMSSHGHSGTSRKQYGRVTKKVMFDAPCATLLIPV